MRFLAYCVLGLTLGAAQTARAQELNRYAIGKESYRGVPVTREIGTSFALGSGIDMRDPWRPVARPTAVFTERTLSMAALHHASDREVDASPLEVNALPPLGGDHFFSQASYSIFDELSIEEERRLLAVHFGGRYKTVSGSVSYSDVQKRRDTHKSIYALIEVSRTGPSLVRNSELQWRVAPRSEAEHFDDQERLLQFLSDYGSHYITALSTGVRIAVRGEIETLDQSRVQRFEAAFKARFGAGGASGSVTNEQELFLQESSTSMEAVITAGEIYPPHAYIFSSFEDIKRFLDAFRAGEIRVTPGVVEINLQSYWHTLDRFPRTRAVLQGVQGQKAESPFGVPAGTIIAWYPRDFHRRAIEVPAEGSESEPAIEDAYILPEGWAVCDGRGDFPDLRGRFVRGSESTVLTHGGQTQHSHSGQADPNPGAYFEGYNVGSRGTQASRNEHGHNLTISAAHHLPPFWDLIYLCKE